ncbi:GGDEF domain-containing protein [Actinocrispum sp. NPDC049592]|uniref:GGDEF domain-containing protein n=1 Tax=Actinocrispum sp. NPDC049592 TaxID=3154835 RepID=UPI003442EE63
MNAVLNGKGLLDPGTGLPGRELLIDRLTHALARARTHGTLVTLTIVAGPPVLATRLRKALREDQTVAHLTDTLIAVITEHPYGTGKPIADRIRRLARTDAGWFTSAGKEKVHEVILTAETHLG